MGRSAATLQAEPRPEDDHGRNPTPQPKEGHRDTVEAIVVAFILALVVRGLRGPGLRDPDRLDGPDA